MSAMDLHWLTPPPRDFRAQCKAALEGPAPGGAIARLATHRLDVNELLTLGKVMTAAIESGMDLSPLSGFRLGVLGNGTTQLWAPAIPASAARHGVAAAITVSEYDQVLQDALDPASRINAGKPDAVLLAIDHRGVPLDVASPGDAADAARTLAKVQSYYRSVRDGIGGGAGCTVIWQTLAAPPESLFGNLDRSVAGAPRWMINEINRWIADECRASGDCLLDVAALAEQTGTSEWSDPVQWNLYKLPFAQRAVPLYADHVGRILGAMRGRARKCLVLDLDNTLWGGAIGDDGIDAIRIGQGTAEGEAFVEVQRYAKSLRDRGVVLAVASRNDETNARLPFREHPDMLLREDDIAAFVANWTDKATNLEAIARHLSIGIDALVLLDDNPAERAHVRSALPPVAVPELPADPGLFVRTLSAAGYFESVALVAEDLQRANAYRTNAVRASELSRTSDIGAYLASLEMVATIAPFDALGRTRIAQLINKSNQFNLTTRRYTVAEVAALQSDENVLTIQARLRDRLGDNGMISVVIVRKQLAVWEIDTWLMSCRVLGRQVETMLLDEIVSMARKHGVRQILGRFIPTKKNELVRDHYARLGFQQSGAEGDATTWTLDVEAYVSPDIAMAVERAAGFVAPAHQPEAQTA